MLYPKHSEKAQGLTEYAMILMLIAVVVIIVMQRIGPTIGNVFSDVIEALELN